MRVESERGELHINSNSMKGSIEREHEKGALRGCIRRKHWEGSIGRGALGGEHWGGALGGSIGKRHWEGALSESEVAPLIQPERYHFVYFKIAFFFFDFVFALNL